MSSNITIVGNLTRDPEMSWSQKGTAVAKFAIAVNKKNKAGDETVSFYEVITFNSLAENIINSLKRGNRVVVNGNVEVRTWEKENGEKGMAVQILADNVGPDLRFNTAIVQAGERPQRPATDAGVTGDYAW